MPTRFLEQSQAARVVLTTGVVAFVVGEVTQVLRARPGSRHVDLRGEVVFRLVFVAGVFLLPAAVAVAPRAVLPGGVAVFVLGVVVGSLGLALRWWSFVALGRYFTFVLLTSPDQVVVDRGPYRVLRHPSYTGLLLAVLGCGLAVGDWVGAVASTLVVLAALVYRIGIEERGLGDALGTAYADFAARRARLVPFVW